MKDKITAEDMIKSLGLENKPKLNLYGVIRRYFWGWNGGFVALIALGEVIAHLTLTLLRDNMFEFPKILHLIAWTVWMCVCLFRISKQKL